MRVIQVRSKQEMRDFIHLPGMIYQGQPCYIPPLWIDEARGYQARHNPILAHSDFTLLLVLNDDQQPVARTVVYIDHKHNDYYHSNIGFFGAFVCIDDGWAATALIQAAEKWLQDKGIAAIRGPINPVAEDWGFLFDSFDRDPVYMSPWNPPYYHRFLRTGGIAKLKTCWSMRQISSRAMPCLSAITNSMPSS